LTRSTFAKTSIFMGTLTILGVLATVVFQIVAARSLVGREFALFATFLSIVNIAAIGSGALQNAVAVNMARSPSFDVDRAPLGPVKNSTLIEAIWLGGSGAVLVVGIFSNTQTGLKEIPAIVFLAAVTVPLSFIFAQQVGLIQGAGHPVSTISWSTTSTFIRLALAWLFLAVMPSALFALINSVVVALGLTVLGTWWLSTRNLMKPSHSPFSKTTLVVV
jgi:O-antigen/teichoic acid export membrane protein